MRLIILFALASVLFLSCREKKTYHPETVKDKDTIPLVQFLTPARPPDTSGNWVKYYKQNYPDSIFCEGDLFVFTSITEEEYSKYSSVCDTSSSNIDKDSTFANKKDGILTIRCKTKTLRFKDEDADGSHMWGSYYFFNGLLKGTNYCLVSEGDLESSNSIIVNLTSGETVATPPFAGISKDNMRIFCYSSSPIYAVSGIAYYKVDSNHVTELWHLNRLSPKLMTPKLINDSTIAFRAFDESYDFTAFFKMKVK